MGHSSMSTEQIILSEEDYRALGGEPGERIDAKTRRAIQPMALTDGTFALSLAALGSATDEQRQFLITLPTRPVAHEEYQWVAEEAARQ